MASNTSSFRRLSSPISSLDGVGKTSTPQIMEPKLAYRPPSSLMEDKPINSTLSQKSHSQSSHEKAKSLTKRSILEPGKMNERRVQAVTLNRSIEEDQPFDMKGGGGKGKIVLITPPRSEDSHEKTGSNQRDNSGFNQAWQQAEQEWQQAEQLDHDQQSQIQNVISDDEHMLQPENSLPAREGMHMIDGEAYEFESFAGDRSTGTGMTGLSSKSVKSDLAFGLGMEVNVNHGASSAVGGGTNSGSHRTKPVSILRNGRFDQGTGGGGMGATSGSDMSVSSKRRMHPWDAEANASPREQTIVEEGQQELVIIEPEKESQQGAQGPSSTNRPETDDDDTLFKFKEDGSKVTSNDSKMSSSTGGSGSRKLSQKDRRRRARIRKEEEFNKGAHSDSCDSIDDKSPSPKKRGDTLQDRTKQAWSARNKSVSMLREEGVKHEPNNAVSFHGDSTVHEYRQEAENSDTGSSDDSGSQYTEYSEFDDETTYTRGEATVMEDMFLDFFMIGGDETRSRRNRSRRKVVSFLVSKESIQSDRFVLTEKIMRQTGIH